MPPLTVPQLKLNQQEKDLVSAWIEEGRIVVRTLVVRPAQAPGRSPVVTNQAGREEDVDRFILARLEDEGLKPSPEAEKTPDPPAVARPDRVAADAGGSRRVRRRPRPRRVREARRPAISRTRTTASRWPCRGSTARATPTRTATSRPERFMSHWRDWVIDAYNANMPFDQFAIEQLAGDLLPNATESQKIATGFNRNHRMNSEGGIIDEEWRVEGVIDRVETTATTFLGLTMAAAAATTTSTTRSRRRSSIRSRPTSTQSTSAGSSSASGSTVA
jgi:hypothetical protein